MREFKGGATKDTDNGKYDYEGFLSPLVIWRFGKYMHKHRTQADGSMRASDNWQNGIPKNVHMKSMWRHFLDTWALHRGLEVIKRRTEKEEKTIINKYNSYKKDEKDSKVNIEDALCGLIFGAMGYLHELLILNDKEITKEIKELSL